MNQEVSKRLEATVGCSCTVTLRDERQTATIEQVFKVVESANFDQAVALSEFKVHLQSGDEMIVPGWMISDIAA